MLPGSACENGIGTPLHYTGETDPDTLRAPRQRYAYLAPLWLQREVDIPADFAGQAVTLFLERVNMTSRLWSMTWKSGGRLWSYLPRTSTT